jgi:uncharacterized membrane protein YeaQ/YmgE (transglycosylase-associated protein family)
VSIIITLVVGLVVGALAKLVMPGRDPGGVFVTMLLGVAGAFVAGLLGHSFGWYAVGQGPGILASIVGSVLILGAYRMTQREL